MRKLFVLICLILLCCPGYLSADMNSYIIGEQGAAAAGVVCDDCSGVRKFSWHMENADITSGDPCGCSDGDETGTINNSPAISGTQKVDGTYSLHCNDDNEYYTFTKSGTDIIDPDDFKITFSIFIVAIPDTHIYLYYAFGDPTDYVYIQLRSSGAIRGTHVGNGTLDTINSAVLGTGSWISLEYQMKVGVDGNDTYLAVSGVGTYEEDDDPVATADQSVAVDIGLNGTITAAGEYYLDNIDVSPSDRY